VHDRRPREYNKLFTFGSVGRSTATDVLVNAQVQSLPPKANKVIAFSDNRQDTALQAAHMNSLHRRFTFRQTLYTALKENGHLGGGEHGARLEDVGSLLFETQQRHDVLPPFHRSQSQFKKDYQAEDRYRRYLQFVALWELGGTHRRTHQNLEDVGLLGVGYYGLEACAEADAFWADVPLMAALEADVRYDLLLGLLDLMRKRHALPCEAILKPKAFEREVIAKLNPAAYVHDQTFRGPIGYSDTARRGYPNTVYRLTGANTQPVVWVKRVFDALGEPLEHAEAVDLVTRIVEKLGDPEAGFLVKRTVSPYYDQQRYDLWMVSPDLLLWADPDPEQHRCPKCGSVHRFLALRVCTGSTCRTTLEERDLTDNYFRQVYATPLGEAVPVQAEEHSGQVEGQERREIELRFRDEEDPLNVLVCTPTMELGIDIGHLNAVTLRNVPPSPSNYAQRAGRAGRPGRAGRSGQPALISVFAGVGSSRGPHDQYFYRFPERMIAGAIAAPRFRLDNEALVSAHVHALVLETMALKGVEGLPNEARQLLDLDQERFPLAADWRSAYQASIEHHFDAIVAAVEEAFAEEIASGGGFAWFDRAFIEGQVRGFVEALDDAMDRWRDEYARLDAEREAINRKLGQESVDPNLNRRRVVIESKLEAMRDGQRDWYLYRYLGGEGFLPGYAFPPQAVALAFDDREHEMARDPDIALTEYAPGNFVYYGGERYEITHARPRRRRVDGPATQPDTELDVEPVLICPACQRAYVGQEETNRAACACGQELVGIHSRIGMALTDMYAQQRAHITADEEERLRLGYEVTPHYRAGGQQRAYLVSAGRAEEPAFTLTLEHGGEVLRINRGQREQEGDPQGFTLCQKCHRWLIGEDAPEKHVYTHEKQGQCSRNAHPEDLARGLWLTTTIQSDLALFDVPLRALVGEQAEPLLPDEVEAFYTTLVHTLARALMVAFNLDEREVSGFLAPAAGSGQAPSPGSEGVPYRVVLYETAVGGSGVLASLAEPGRLATVIARARELLHEGDPEGGCQKACYTCLLSFYNQRDHALLDRTLVLPWLQGLEDVTVKPLVTEGRFEELIEQCQSGLERDVLAAIRERGLPLPDAAQETLYDGDAPLAIADFFYAPKIVVFVDGSPHYRDYVQQADRRKRMRLKGLGYRVVVVTAEEPEVGLDALAARLAN
ncbi:MAG: helicase-related protein, partial [Armatimonadota bacterium]